MDTFKHLSTHVSTDPLANTKQFSVERTTPNLFRTVLYYRGAVLLPAVCGSVVADAFSTNVGIPASAML